MLEYVVNEAIVACVLLVKSCLLKLRFSFPCREVIESTMKIGETNARLKQIEVGLDAAQLAKQNAEAEAALDKEKAEILKSEVKRIELMVSVVCSSHFHYGTFHLLFIGH